VFRLVSDEPLPYSTMFPLGPLEGEMYHIATVKIWPEPDLSGFTGAGFGKNYCTYVNIAFLNLRHITQHFKCTLTRKYN